MFEVAELEFEKKIVSHQLSLCNRKTTRQNDQSSQKMSSNGIIDENVLITGKFNFNIPPSFVIMLDKVPIHDNIVHLHPSN
jgi:hypothetical protein